MWEDTGWAEADMVAVVWWDRREWEDMVGPRLRDAVVDGSHRVRCLLTVVCRSAVVARLMGLSLSSALVVEGSLVEEEGDVHMNATALRLAFLDGRMEGDDQTDDGLMGVEALAGARMESGVVDMR